MPNDYMYTKYTFNDDLASQNQDVIVREKEIKAQATDQYATSSTSLSNDGGCTYVDCNNNDAAWWYRMKSFGRMCAYTSCTIINAASSSTDMMTYATTNT